MAHGKSEAGEAIARAAWVGAASLDDEQYRLHTDRILEAPRADRVEQAGGRDEGSPLPTWARDKLAAAHTDLLETWSDRILDATTLEDALQD